MAGRRTSRLGWIILGVIILIGLAGEWEEPAPQSQRNETESSAPSADPTVISPDRIVSESVGVTYYTRTNLRLRSRPSTGASVITTLQQGAKVQSYERQGVWHAVRVAGQRGWVHGDYLSTLAPTPPKPTAIEPARPRGQAFTCTTPVPTLKDQMIRESIARYQGSCACDYHRDRGGRRCGARSAWSRPGGASPLCYPSEISADMVREFCEVLKLRAGGR